jgi:hypothetical protein
MAGSHDQVADVPSCVIGNKVPYEPDAAALGRRHAASSPCLSAITMRLRQRLKAGTAATRVLGAKQ